MVKHEFTGHPFKHVIVDVSNDVEVIPVVNVTREGTPQVKNPLFIKSFTMRSVNWDTRVAHTTHGPIVLPVGVFTASHQGEVEPLTGLTTRVHD